MFPFEVDPTSDLPLWVQLRNRIAYLINDGTLAPGDKLPTASPSIRVRSALLLRTS